MRRSFSTVAASLCLVSGLASVRAVAQDAPLEAETEALADTEIESEPEPEPLEIGDYAQPKEMRTCSTQDVLNGVCTSAEAAQASTQRIWRLMARMELVLPVIIDESPENETLLYYYLGAEVDLPFLRGLYAVGWIGLQQRFWRIEGQSPVDLEDPLLGLGYRHTIGLGGAHNLVLVHRFGAYFPASRPSRANLFYTTLDWVTAARYPFEVENLGKFVIGANIWSQLAFQKYETQSGESISADFDAPGGSNTVFRLEGVGLLQYTVFDLPSAGDLVADVAAGYRYRARLSGSYEPDWYWTLGATYTPISYFSVGLSLEHGYSDILRGGVSHLVAFDRDETMWRLTLYGRY